MTPHFKYKLAKGTLLLAKMYREMASTFQSVLKQKSCKSMNVI